MDKALLLLAALLLARPAPAAVPPDRVARLARGINISEVIQGHATFGGDPARFDAILAALAAAGFTNIRLPAGSGLLVPGSDRFGQPGAVTPDDYRAGMNTLRQLIGMILAHGMAVTVDMHQDSPGFVQALHCTVAAACARAEQQLLGFWRQAARDLADTDPARVFLELLNEPNMTPAQWAAFSPALLAAVRQAAPRHTIIMGAAEWYSLYRLTEMAPYADDNLVYTFHFYEPMEFTHQGASWNTEMSGLKDIRFPTTLRRKSAWPPFVRTELWDRARIAALFARAAAWGRSHGVPVITNEFGAIANAPMPDRACWLLAVRTAAEANGIGWAYWDYVYPEAFGLEAVRGASPPAFDQALAAALGLKGAPPAQPAGCA